MKTALITTAAALLLASVCSASSFAQHYDDENHGGSYGHHYRGDYDQQSGRHVEEDRDQSRERDRSRDMGSMMNDRSRDMGLMNRAMMFRRGGARFQFSKGDAHIDIRCPQNETLQNCVDAASRLIDKVHSLEPGSAEPSTAH
jgi:hypothetical protein